MKVSRTMGVLAVAAALLLAPTVAGAAPATGGAGADYGMHISSHARAEHGFSGDMNPGMHRGFAGFDEHH